MWQLHPFICRLILSNGSALQTPQNFSFTLPPHCTLFHSTKIFLNNLFKYWRCSWLKVRIITTIEAQKYLRRQICLNNTALNERVSVICLENSTTSMDTVIYVYKIVFIICNKWESFSSKKIRLIKLFKRPIKRHLYFTKTYLLHSLGQYHSCLRRAAFALGLRPYSKILDHVRRLVYSVSVVEQQRWWMVSNNM